MSPTAPFLAAERDTGIKVGRPKLGSSVLLGLPGVGFTSTATLSQTAGEDVFGPFQIPSPLVVDQLIFEVSTGTAGNARVGLYKANVNWQPSGTPLADSGDIDTTGAAVKTYTPTNPLYLSRGRYLMVTNCSATPTFRVFTGLMFGADSGLSATAFAQRLRKTRAYAAFTSTATWDNYNVVNSTYQHQVLLRTSTP